MRHVSLLYVCALVLSSCEETSAQKMPREHVVDVPTIGDGLCVSNVFQSHMVLQRDKPVSIWGWATPDEVVTVKFGDQQQTATAAEDRSWNCLLYTSPSPRD